MQTMRAVLLTEPGRFELAEIPVPRPGAGEAVVAVDACGVCGSDVHLVDGSTVAAEYPVVLGHEAAGTVAALGPDTTGIEVGTRVAVLPYVGCGRCGRCWTRQPQACAERKVLGVDMPGAQADRLVVPTGCLVPLPDTVPAEIGAILTDAVATPFHAIRRSHVVPGETAVVFGLGGLGMHAVQILAGVLGCEVIAVDPRPQARERAAALGAKLTLDAGRQVARTVVAETRGGADVAFEFVGHPEIVGTALRCLRPQGTCVVVGISPDRLALGMRQETLVSRELRLVGSFGCTAAELAELVDLVATGRLDLTGSVSDVYAPGQFAAALAETRDKRAGSVRVVVSYR
ncbi:zinc-binding dehydrogenase [Actinophytocola sp.]|uniref:alcohol dehydrogenase catalytic domain-containing protein n=1 Tax=Actinophytocola sp. TaxID=1872138 RepID=UPI002ED7EE76